MALPRLEIMIGYSEGSISIHKNIDGDHGLNDYSFQECFFHWLQISPKGIYTLWPLIDIIVFSNCIKKFTILHSHIALK